MKHFLIMKPLSTERILEWWRIKNIWRPGSKDVTTLRTEEVSKQALLDGLRRNKVRVFGFSVQPSLTCLVLKKMEGLNDTQQKQKIVETHYEVMKRTSFLCIIFYKK
ncbi:uncharacterized protein [Rutidosis leptorrhynchoides]|uniref:uncharacterized protein n=1 Tax=Rutidosis leptorrhynchoides TaxID=125765 RepID=UPI003A99165C